MGARCTHLSSRVVQDRRWRRSKDRLRSSSPGGTSRRLRGRLRHHERRGWRSHHGRTTSRSPRRRKLPRSPVLRRIRRRVRHRPARVRRGASAEAGGEPVDRRCIVSDGPRRRERSPVRRQVGELAAGERQLPLGEVVRELRGLAGRASEVPAVHECLDDAQMQRGDAGNRPIARCREEPERVRRRVRSSWRVLQTRWGARAAHPTTYRSHACRIPTPAPKNRTA